MSALARYFNNIGVKVCGYDRTSTPLTDVLSNEGIIIHFEENIDLIPEDVQLVIFTPAIPEQNIELKFFEENNFEIKKRSEILGQLTNEVFTVAIAGTHGKTTISSIITHICKFNKLNITSFVGGISKNYDSNFIGSEKTDLIIVEADEFDRSFLTLYPDIAVISSIDADHLDIYGSKEYMEESFSLFVNQIKKTGKLIIKNKLLENKNIEIERISYSYEDKCNAYAFNIKNNPEKCIFSIKLPDDTIIENISFYMQGYHNIENTVAAAVVAHNLKIENKNIKSALETYTGVKRRFDYIINSEKIVYIDDYAHHPEELKATINSVKAIYPDKIITGIFQPHLFTRTRDFANEFAKSLDLLDEIILLDIYPARELPIEGINSQMLMDKISNKNKKLLTKINLLDELKNMKSEVVLTLGAGDIDQLVKPIEDILNDKI